MRFERETRAGTCPFTGEKVALLRSFLPDVALIHAHRADSKGNVQLDRGYVMENIADGFIVRTRGGAEIELLTPAPTIACPGFTSHLRKSPVVLPREEIVDDLIAEAGKVIVGQQVLVNRHTDKILAAAPKA